MQRRIIGFAGTIAAGKSKRIKHLAKLWDEQHQQLAAAFPTVAFKTIDADVVGHKCYEPGTATYFKVIDQFGKDILSATTTAATSETEQENLPPIDRKKLGAIVFSSKEKMEQLNQIVWPAIALSIADDISATEKSILAANQEGKTTIKKTHLVYAVEAAVLPHMKEMLLMVDEVWLYHVQDDIAVKRVMERNHLPEEEAKKRVNAQSKLEEKIFLVEGAKKKLRLFDTTSVETETQLEESLHQQAETFRQMLKEFTTE
jgi:dephospho-CoA kinase